MYFGVNVRLHTSVLRAKNVAVFGCMYICCLTRAPVAYPSSWQSSMYEGWLQPVDAAQLKADCFTCSTLEGSLIIWPLGLGDHHV